MNDIQDPGGGDLERRAILATVLAVIVIIVYQVFFMPSPPPPPEPQQEQAEEKKPPAPPVATPKPRTGAPRIAGPPRRGAREEEVALETDLLMVIMTNRGGGVRSWQLKKYEEKTGLVDLVGPLPNEESILPLTTWIEGGQGRKGLYRIVERPTADRTKPQRLVMEFQDSGGILLEKTMVLHPGRYLADVEFRVKNLGTAPAEVSLRVQWGPGFRFGAHEGRSASVFTVAWIDGKLMKPKLAEDQNELAQPGAVSWTALEDNYFAAVLLPQEPGPSNLVGKDAEGRPFVGLLYPAVEISPGAEVKLGSQLFAGPKEIGRLREVGRNLQQLVDLGWFDFVARPALYLLKYLYDFTGNYGVAIIIITVLQKIGFYPLTQKSQKSMQAMQALQPKIQAIRERHKSNPQKMNQETMELYKRHGVNPLGGCLPMVIQIPIFIALYNAFASSVELWRAPFALWIDDLSAPDTLFALPFPVPYLGDAFPFRGLPLIMGISMFIQQKMSPTSGDPRQAQMMLYLMPIMFTFIFWGMPSGLVLYWLVNNVLQIGQQYHVNKGLGLLMGTGKDGTEKEAE